MSEQLFGPDIPHRICRNCDPPHVENCETCFGWGLYVTEGKQRPIAASGLDKPHIRDAAVACPECGGTLCGAPTMTA